MPVAPAQIREGKHMHAWKYMHWHVHAHPNAHMLLQTQLHQRLNNTRNICKFFGVVIKNHYANQEKCFSHHVLQFWFYFGPYFHVLFAFSPWATRVSLQTTLFPSSQVPLQTSSISLFLDCLLARVIFLSRSTFCQSNPPILANYSNHLLFTASTKTENITYM